MTGSSRLSVTQPSFAMSNVPNNGVRNVEFSRYGGNFSIFSSQSRGYLSRHFIRTFAHAMLLTVKRIIRKMVVTIGGHLLHVRELIAILKVFRITALRVRSTWANVVHLFPFWNWPLSKDHHGSMGVNLGIDSLAALDHSVASRPILAARSSASHPRPAIVGTSDVNLCPKAFLERGRQSLLLQIFRGYFNHSIRLVDQLTHVLNGKLDLMKDKLLRHRVNRLDGKMGVLFAVEDQAHGEKVALGVARANKTIHGFECSGCGFCVLRSWEILTMFVHSFVLAPFGLLAQRSFFILTQTSVNSR